MALAGFVVGFYDFEFDLPIQEVASILSKNVFGGIAFVEKITDEDYDAGNLCLSHNFLGIQAELIGGDGGYTLELCAVPSATLEDSQGVCDVSPVLKHIIGNLPGVSLTTFK